MRSFNKPACLRIFREKNLWKVGRIETIGREARQAKVAA